MIKTQFGVTQITTVSDAAREILNIPKDQVDEAVKTMLGADLSTILLAFVQEYGEEEAFKMWTRAAEVAIEALKENTI